MAKRDFYEVLEVSKNASKEEIKKAYRKQAIVSIRIKIRVIRKPKKSSKKQQKLMKCWGMMKNVPDMTNMDMPELAEPPVEVLVIP